MNANVNRMRDLIRQYGSEADLIKNYVSRLGKRLLAEGKTPVEIIKMVEAGEITSKADAPRESTGRRGRPVGSKNTSMASTDIPDIGEDISEDSDTEAVNFLQGKPTGIADKKI
jgi:hypothetical protein